MKRFESQLIFSPIEETAIDESTYDFVTVECESGNLEQPRNIGVLSQRHLYNHC